MPLVRKRRVTAQEDEDVSEAELEPRTQRRRISPTEDDEGYADGAEEATQGDSSQEQMVKNMVRLALASEYSRTPIRRTDISAKVLGTQGRQFKNVFAQAQQQLREVFGMEMSELPIRDKVTIAQKRAAAKTQNAQKTSSAWIVTTILPDRFRDPSILPPPQVPTSEAESQYTAVASFIIALIMLSGGTLQDSRLDRYLSRANINEVTPFSNSVSINLDKTEKLLKKLEKDGYVVKIKDTSSGEETIEWVVGPRGKIEVGDKGVRGLVKTVYGDVEDEEEFRRRLERSLGVLEPKGAAVNGQVSKKKTKSKSSQRKGQEEDAGEEEEDSDED